MPTQGDFYSVAIQRMIKLRPGTTPDASMVAEATLNIWHRMAALLAPIIGTRGFEVLFNRSLQLTSRAFPCLVIIENHRDNAVLLANIRENLAAGTTKDAMEAGHALLVTFTELLSTLIGDSLTNRLLSPVWAISSPIPEQETEL